VQYAFSNHNFQKAYKQLILKYIDIVFVQEDRFEKAKITNPLTGSFLFNLYVWITNYRFRKCKSNFRTKLIQSISDSDYKYFMFLTDDSLFYKNIDIQNKLLNMLNTSTGSAYSLIFGKNIFGGKFKQTDTHLEWDVDSKSTQNIWTYAVLFTNPNTFEGIMVAYNASRNVFTKVYSNLQSCLIGFELNKVQTEYDNNHIDVDHNQMNDLYLSGYQLDIEVDQDSIFSFHPTIKSVKMYSSTDEISII
jgi:hypothetical protein